MTIESIFYTQVVSIISFIIAVFILYRLLVTQKDSIIELLKARICSLEDKISDLQSQSPDILVESIAKRVEIAKAEIKELHNEGDAQKNLLSEKEAELGRLSKSIEKLNGLMEDYGLLCPDCQAPLFQRGYHTIFGEINGKECEADIEYVEYECGLVLEDGKMKSPCRRKEI